jgi:hypothetical protein
MRKLLLVPLIVLAALVVAAAPAAASSDNHCIAPTGVDLNVFYGVSHPIVAPFCNEVAAGEEWSVAARWYTNTTFVVTPAGFVPAGATPMDDFVAKFIGVKYIVDPGTAQEKTYLFKNKRHLWIGIDSGFPLVNTLTMGTIQPLSVGQHVVETFWLFSAMHCDGFGDVMIENCLPAGQTQYSTIQLDVRSAKT